MSNPGMTDEWLAEACKRAVVVAAGTYEPEHQEIAFLRGFANRVLFSFADKADEAMRIEFTGRLPRSEPQ